MKPVVMIAGPTASGKSALAIRLAQRLDGEVINADSMQVYKDLRVISARPSDEEMEGIPHHLFGHVDASVRYSVGAWVRDSVPVILECLARGKTPICVGGTGLYFKALTDGLADIPDVPEALMQDLKQRLETDGYAALQAKAMQVDPVATQRLLGRDPQRLLRVLSVYEQSGQPLSFWQAKTRPVVPKRYWRGIVLNPPRGELYRRINARFLTMIDNGGLAEVERVLKRGLPEDLPLMKAIGVKQALKADGPLWIETCQRDTRRFAKRQKTFFRKYAEDWAWNSRLNVSTVLELVNYINSD